MNRDTLVLLAFELELPEIIPLCNTNSRINRWVCENRYFWANKGLKDFGARRITKNQYYNLYNAREESFNITMSHIPIGYKGARESLKKIFDEDFKNLGQYANQYYSSEGYNEIQGIIIAFAEKYLPIEADYFPIEELITEALDHKFER